MPARGYAPVFPLALLVMTAPTDAPVTLPEAHNFGVTRAVALLNRDLTARHNQRVVVNFESWCQSAWSFRQENVFHCWAFLADALDEGAPVPVRLRNLDNLKYRLGAEAYAAGWMPAAIPNYKPAKPWQKD